MSSAGRHGVANSSCWVDERYEVGVPGCRVHLDISYSRRPRTHGNVRQSIELGQLYHLEIIAQHCPIAIQVGKYRILSIAKSGELGRSRQSVVVRQQDPVPKHIAGQNVKIEDEITASRLIA